MTARVRVVVLNFNGGEHVLDCLSALRKTQWSSSALEVVVVDNASSDGSDVEIAKQFPDVRLIRSPQNTGFPANNLAMRDLENVDFVALVNNDAFVEPNWLEPLVDALASDPTLGAACPKIVFAPTFVDVDIETPTSSVIGDGRQLGVRVSGVEVGGADAWKEAQLGDGCWGMELGSGDESRFSWTAARATIRVPLSPDARDTVQVRMRLAADVPKQIVVTSNSRSIAATVGTSPRWVTIAASGPGYDVINNVGSQLVTLGYGADRGYLERDDGQYEEPAEVFAWCGGGVLLRREYLDEVGLFDERFFLYYEDTDLAWRGRARGWRYVYVPGSVVRHIHAASSVEGSLLFQHFVERNRLAMLAKNAPLSLLGRALYRYVRMIVSYTVRLGLPAVVRRKRPPLGLPRRRAKSLIAFVALLPSLWRDRRTLRRAQVVRDRELLSWIVNQ